MRKLVFLRALFGWLGFRYLRLRTFGEAQEATPIEREAVVA